jgi:hypothetical protein
MSLLHIAHPTGRAKLYIPQPLLPGREKGSRIEVPLPKRERDLAIIWLVNYLLPQERVGSVLPLSDLSRALVA